MCRELFAPAPQKRESVLKEYAKATTRAEKADFLKKWKQAGTRHSLPFRHTSFVLSSRHTHAHSITLKRIMSPHTLFKDPNFEWVTTSKRHMEPYRTRQSTLYRWRTEAQIYEDEGAKKSAPKDLHCTLDFPFISWS